MRERDGSPAHQRGPAHTNPKRSFSMLRFPCPGGAIEFSRGRQPAETAQTIGLAAERRQRALSHAPPPLRGLLDEAPYHRGLAP
jgi:hypothetical protein